MGVGAHLFSLKTLLYLNIVIFHDTDTEVSEEEVKLIQDLIKHIKTQQQTFVDDEKVGDVNEKCFNVFYCSKERLLHEIMFFDTSPA